MRLSRILTALCALLLICALPALAEAPILDASTPEAYRDDLTLTEVVISKDTQAIGPRAFAGCTNLKSVTLPYGLNDIHPTAFEGCEGVKLYIVGNWDSSESYYFSKQAEFAGQQGMEYVSRNQIDPEGYVYVIDEGECTVLCYTGTAAEVDLPAEIEGCPVTRVGENAFRQNRRLTRIAIPSSVRAIDANALMFCEKLKKVQLSEGLETIGEGMCSNCASLTSFAVPASVRRIEGDPVGGCLKLGAIDVVEGSEVYRSQDGLVYDAAMTRLIQCPAGRRKAVSVPMGVVRIEENAFKNCFFLSGVTLPPTLREIGRNAFWNCGMLKQIALPVSLEKIDGNPFGACWAIGKFTIPEENPWYCAVDGLLYDKAMTRLISAPPRKTGRVALPDTVKIIEDCAFHGGRVKEVVLPEGLTRIGESAFDDCESLTSVTLPSTITDIGEFAFAGCTKLKEIDVPEGVTELASSLFNRDGKLSRVTLPSTLQRIDWNAFGRCAALKDLTVPDGVTEIRDDAFEDCPRLTLHGTAGGYAEQFAAEHGIAFSPVGEAAAWAEQAADVLEKGSKGEKVKALQQRLIELGFLTGRADGDYGSGTAKAVSAFQKSVGLPETGAADSDTRAKLFE